MEYLDAVFSLFTFGVNQTLLVVQSKDVKVSSCEGSSQASTYIIYEIIHFADL